MQAAILFEPDGYLLDGPKLMGRQSAGNSFLRAAVQANSGGMLVAYTPWRSSFDTFERVVRELDSTVQARMLPPNRLDLLTRIGTLYRPDHALDVPAAARLRAGLAAFSLCGVTHTLSSEVSIRHLLNFLTTPLTPWDALICTSRVARELVQKTLANHAHYMSWQIGQPVVPPELQLPVIPLGVHTADFTTSANARAEARRRVGIDDDEIAALFAGRLSFTAKAHPVSMLKGLQAAAERTGRRITFIMAGKFQNDAMEEVYRTAISAFAPSVRPLFIDGADFDAYNASWRAADLFLSLSDNIQETFGLTPVEAMAAGLPVVVSDWNGYKDTIRDGLDGFRIPTWAPARQADDAIARDYEARASNLDMYLARISGAVSVDQRQLNDRLTELVGNAELRARLGRSGREHARTMFDWSVIYPQYLELWAELAAIRQTRCQEPFWKARIAAAPRCHSVSPDPYALFAHYPTALLNPETIIEPVSEPHPYTLSELADQSLFGLLAPAMSTANAVLNALAGPSRIADVMRATGLDELRTIDTVGRLAKMGFISIQDERDAP
jgi:glycosyltransferase involved in cell wall biosynthesis